MDMQDTKTKYAEARANHEKADLAFDAAIKKQFGPAATRWSKPTKAYNEETKAAYLAKVSASELQSKAFEEII